MTTSFDYTEFAGWREYHELGDAIRKMANRLDDQDRRNNGGRVPDDAREAFTSMVAAMASASHFGHVCRCCPKAMDYVMTPVRVERDPERDSARVLFVCRFCRESQSFGFSEVSPV